jgi:P27 family predicted phage terminase small subunit
MKKSNSKDIMRIPPGLPKEAQTLWRDVIAYLRRTGLLVSIDASIVETYCLAVHRQRCLCAELERTGPLDATGKPNPLLRTIEATAATVARVGHLLALNPMSRKSLPAKASEKRRKDIWEGILS